MSLHYWSILRLVFIMAPEILEGRNPQEVNIPQPKYQIAYHIELLDEQYKRSQSALEELVM